MAKSDFVFEKDQAIDVGSAGSHSHVFADGKEVADNGVSNFVFEVGTGIGGGGGVIESFELLNPLDRYEGQVGEWTVNTDSSKAADGDAYLYQSNDDKDLIWTDNPPGGSLADGDNVACEIWPESDGTRCEFAFFVTSNNEGYTVILEYESLYDGGTGFEVRRYDDISSNNNTPIGSVQTATPTQEYTTVRAESDPNSDDMTIVFLDESGSQLGSETVTDGTYRGPGIGFGSNPIDGNGGRWDFIRKV